MTKTAEHKHISQNKTQTDLNNIIENLCHQDSLKTLHHRASHDAPMPKLEDLEEIVELLRSVIFPGYWGNPDVKPETIRYYIGASIDRIFLLLSEQIKRGLCFTCTSTADVCDDCDKKARNKTIWFLEKLTTIRDLLATDVEAAYDGDPATSNKGEIIFCYPSISALTNYRIAHELYKLEIPFIPRIISEMAHSKTGIDIHPGAEIGERCFIDHGTGVVIGETCIIGNNTRIYQGVTLGAKSFDLDEDGNPVKGIPRHPIVEENVIIYSGATILGRITIGRDSVIGGNVWITHDIPPGSRVLQKDTEYYFEKGTGI